MDVKVCGRRMEDMWEGRGGWRVCGREGWVGSEGSLDDDEGV